MRGMFPLVTAVLCDLVLWLPDTEMNNLQHGTPEVQPPNLIMHSILSFPLPLYLTMSALRLSDSLRLSDETKVNFALNKMYLLLFSSLERLCSAVAGS